MRLDAVAEWYSTVGAREDIDGTMPVVVLCPDRRANDEDYLEIEMTPKVARAIARKLNRWAKAVST